MYNRLDRIPACDRQTERHIAKLPRHSPRYAYRIYASRVKNRFSPYFIFCFPNEVWTSASGGFGIVFDTLVKLEL